MFAVRIFNLTVLYDYSLLEYVTIAVLFRHQSRLLVSDVVLSLNTFVSVYNLHRGNNIALILVQQESVAYKC